MDGLAAFFLGCFLLKKKNTRETHISIELEPYSIVCTRECRLLVQKKKIHGNTTNKYISRGI